MMAGEEDVISNLPEPILHHCLSFFPTKDAIPTSTLSKKWKSIWDSFPILDFDQAAFEKSFADKPLRPLQLTEMFLDYLSSSIQRRHHMSRKLQKFRLVAHLRGSQMHIPLDTAIMFAVENGVQELELSISVQVQKFFSPPETLYSAKSVSVVKLINLNVRLPDLIQGCPLIEELSIQCCQVSDQHIKLIGQKLKTFELRNCTNVRSLTMEAINLQSFIFVGEFRACCLRITACRALKMVSLHRTLIEHQWLQDVISQLVLLKTLELEFCIGLTGVEVFHQQLRRLKLCVCDDEKVAEIKIDTPKLGWFLYHGKPKRFGIFNSSGVLDAMLSLPKPDGVDSIQWFDNLRGFLLMFGHCKMLHLRCDEQKDLITNRAIRNGFLPPLYDLKHLDIEISDQDSANFDQLVDTVLWLSPHLEILAVISRHTQISFKFEREKREDEEAFCCGEYPTECWKYYLKKVILSFYKGSNDNKEDLFAYFRQRAKRLESVVDDSTFCSPPKRDCVLDQWKEVRAGRWLAVVQFRRIIEP